MRWRCDSEDDFDGQAEVSEGGEEEKKTRRPLCSP